MVVTGLRRGELCGLRREDIDNGRLCVRRSVTQNCEITQGKTKAAQRTMVITDHAQKILDDQAAMLRAAGIVSPWLFPGGDGSMTYPKLMYKRWKVYRRQHNITVSLHELRHPYVKLKLKFLLTQHYRCISAKVLDFPLNFKPVVGVNIHFVYEHICECLCQGVFLFHCFCCLQSF